MRIFSTTDIQIINKILTQDLQNMPVVCKFLKQYFVKNKMALFLSSSQNEVFILYKDEDACKASLALIVELISLFEAMEEDGYLYCINLDNDQPFFLYESLDVDIGINADGTSFTIKNGSLSINDGAIFLKDISGNIILKGSRCQKLLANQILYYFKSTIYPSTSLRKLADDGYESLEILSYKKEVKSAKFSRNMAWSALIISLFLPFAITFYNNKFAKTEIKDSQYNSILYKMNAVAEKIDTLCKHFILEQKEHDISKDTIPCLKKR